MRWIWLTSCARSAPEANKALLLRFYEEVINQEDKAVINAIFAPDAILHDPFTGTQQGDA